MRSEFDYNESVSLYGPSLGPLMNEEAFERKTLLSDMKAQAMGADLEQAQKNNRTLIIVIAILLITALIIISKNKQLPAFIQNPDDDHQDDDDDDDDDEEDEEEDDDDRNESGSGTDGSSAIAGVGEGPAECGTDCKGCVHCE